MSNGPAMPSITAGVQTPVVGACGISEVMPVLVTFVGLSHEGDRMHSGTKKEEKE